ncbi:hypothetical protein RA8P1_00363 (plasmid) [Variovorax sp. RA8]|nr:hypothetical protein RA8P1_00363 [Variovorax sp. RA8]
MIRWSNAAIARAANMYASSSVRTSRGWNCAVCAFEEATRRPPPRRTRPTSMVCVRGCEPRQKGRPGRQQTVKAKAVVPRGQANRDIEDAVAYDLGEGAQSAALSFIDELEEAYVHIRRCPGTGVPRATHTSSTCQGCALGHWLASHTWSSASSRQTASTFGASSTAGGIDLHGCKRPKSTPDQPCRRSAAIGQRITRQAGRCGKRLSFGHIPFV